MPKIFHAFIDPIADDSAIPGVRPSNWNAALQYGNSAATAPSGADAILRQILTTNINYYVSATGSDSNDGLTPATAWATLQHAADYLAVNFDFSGFIVTINVGAGQFLGPILPAFTGGGVLQLQGAGSALTTITIPSAAHPIVVNVHASLGNTILAIDNVTLDGSIKVGGTTASALYSMAASGNTVYFSTFDGTPGTIVLKPGDNTVIGGCITGEGPLIYFILSNMVVDGSGTAVGVPTIFSTQSLIIVDFAAWTFINTPNFNTGLTGSFISCVWEGIYLGLGATYSGAFTGQFVGLYWSSIASFDSPSILVGTVPNVVDSTSRVVFTAGETQGWGGDGTIQISGLPSTTQLPVPATTAVFKDTSGQGNYHVVNDGGAIKRIAFDIVPSPPVIFANLPAAPTQGMMVSITDGKAANCADGTCSTFGTIVSAGGGALKLNLWYNGAHWTLTGI